MKPIVVLPLLVGIQRLLLIKSTFVSVLVSKLNLKETVLVSNLVALGLKVSYTDHI